MSQLPSDDYKNYRHLKDICLKAYPPESQEWMEETQMAEWLNKDALGFAPEVKDLLQSNDLYGMVYM